MLQGTGAWVTRRGQLAAWFGGGGRDRVADRVVVDPSGVQSLVVSPSHQSASTVSSTSRPACALVRSVKSLR